MFQLCIELFSFETATIEAQLLSYIEKIQRKHPTFQPDEYKMLPHHNVLQFNLPGENSEMPAFDYYEVQMQLVQHVRPSHVYFTATLMGFDVHFLGADYIDAFFYPNGHSTIFGLSTSDGSLTTPPVLNLSVENESCCSIQSQHSAREPEFFNPTISNFHTC